MTIQDFINNGVRVTNDRGEVRETSANMVVFPNGWMASIVDTDKGLSVAACDYNGYFNWDALEPFGNGKGVILCNTEDEVCSALNIVKSLRYPA